VPNGAAASLPEITGSTGGLRLRLIDDLKAPFLCRENDNVENGKRDGTETVDDPCFCIFAEQRSNGGNHRESTNFADGRATAGKPRALLFGKRVKRKRERERERER